LCAGIVFIGLDIIVVLLLILFIRNLICCLFSCFFRGVIFCLWVDWEVSFLDRFVLSFEFFIRFSVPFLNTYNFYFI